MILNTPKMDLVNVFDANYAHTFSFTYSVEQAVKNRLVIKKNTTLETVYDNIQVGLRTQHTIDANVLENNMTYIVQVQVYDVNNNSSNFSEAIMFSCYTTPQFYFSNVNNNDVVSTANLLAQTAFTQSEGDSISEYVYYLYDSNKNELLQSPTYYLLTDNTYYGLENLTSYYIRAVGKSQYGFLLDTGYINIQVKYNSVPTNIVLSAENKDGKIIISTNIAFTDYELENDNYTLKDGELILQNNSVSYKVNDIVDFSLVVKARNVLLDNFINIIGENGNAHVSLVSINDVYYCKLNVNDSYVIYKNILGKLAADTDENAIIDTKENALRTSVGEYNKTALVIYEIKRNNGLYSLEAYYQ